MWDWLYKSSLSPLQQDQVALGDQHLIFAFDHNDNGLAGEVQIPDLLAVPRTLLPQDHFLQVDVGVIIEGGGAQVSRIS